MSTGPRRATSMTGVSFWRPVGLGIRRPKDGVCDDVLGRFGEGTVEGWQEENEEEGEADEEEK